MRTLLRLSIFHFDMHDALSLACQSGSSDRLMQCFPILVEKDSKRWITTRGLLKTGHKNNEPLAFERTSLRSMILCWPDGANNFYPL